jgi:hypothetical protein
MLPNFLIIGAHKAGTTSVHQYLLQHPSVYMSPVKEPRYFALKDDPLDYRGPDDPARKCEHKTPAAYEELFAAASNEVARGEASTLYLYHESAARNIHELIPKVRLIAILRNPVDRAYSNFTFARMQNREPLADPIAAMDAEEERVRFSWGPLWHYKRKGLYGAQLQRYFEIFDASQIHVALFDDLRRSPQTVIGEMFDFLGLERIAVDVESTHNPSGVPKTRLLERSHGERGVVRRALAPALKSEVAQRWIRSIRNWNLQKAPPMPESLRAALEDYYRSDRVLLRQLLGRELSEWDRDAGEPA